MKINIKETIEFLDSRSEKGLANSIIGVIGEDLNAYSFVDYLKRELKAEKAEILPFSVTTGKNIGKRLDRWIFVEYNGKKILYQCEIKNWAAMAINGRSLGIEASNENKINVANANWENQVNGEFSDRNYPNGVTKVLVKMKHPKGYDGIKVEPLILYWMPISNTPNLKSFFKVAISAFNNQNLGKDFSELNIFSVSLYLRSLLEKGVKSIEIDGKNIEQKLKVLYKICLDKIDANLITRDDGLKLTDVGKIARL